LCYTLTEYCPFTSSNIKYISTEGAIDDSFPSQLCRTINNSAILSVIRNIQTVSERGDVAFSSQYQVITVISLPPLHGACFSLV